MPRKLNIKLYITVIRPVFLYGVECWPVRKKDEHILEKTEMWISRRIKGCNTVRQSKGVDIRKELGVNSIQEKVREMRQRWYGHMQRMEETSEQLLIMWVPGNRQRRSPRWIASERTCRNCGSPRSMPMTEYSGKQEFGPLKRRRRRS